MTKSSADKEAVRARQKSIIVGSSAAALTVLLIPLGIKIVQGFNNRKHFRRRNQKEE